MGKLEDRQAWREWREYHRALKRDNAVDRLTPIERKKKREKLESDPFVWIPFFFAEYARYPFAPFQKRAIRRITSHGELYDVLSWSRELAKSTIVFMCVMYLVLTDRKRNVLLVSNSHDNAEVWRKAWADLANSFLEQSNRPERIDHRSYERQGIEQIPTVHIGVAASQMEKKGIVTERGELNRSIKAANRMLREIRAQIGKLKEWLSEIFKAKEALRAEPQQPKSPDLSTLLFRYLDIQKAKGRKYSQSWQQQHTADELKAISKAVNLLAEKGIFTLEELDAALSSVSDKASEIRGAMKPREARIKQLQKLIEQAQNFQKTKPVHDEYKQIRWKGKQEKFAETHRADLTIWEAANRYLRANLPDMKLAPKAWQTELAKLTAENEAEYAKLKAQREVVSDLQKIHRYVDIALKEDAPQQSKTRNHNIDR